MIFAPLASIAAILCIDQTCKFLILKYLTLNTSTVLIKNILSITPILNTGGGFGIFPNQILFFIITSLVAIIVIGYVMLTGKIKQKAVLYSLTLILAGALGNLIDRLRFGAVVDFIDFHIWPIFNIADACISIGAVILIWQMIKKK